ncbi:MAG: hypothetical protein K2J71_08385 [Oscillospiraceae bacterium]|nr:hypothetical protein [Oscillospiraceae bacterium]
MQEDLHRELKFAVICTGILDLILWIVSLILVKFQEFRMDVLSGLILGSSGMILNLFLLRRTILHAVRYGKTKDWVGYLLRCLVASGVIMISLLSDYVNTFTVVLPFLYPKLIFGVCYLKLIKFIKN